jgi:hypothetical protein
VGFNELSTQRAGAGAVLNLTYRDADRVITENKKQESDPVLAMLRQQGMLPGMTAQVHLDSYGNVINSLLDPRVQNVGRNVNPLMQRRVQSVQGFHDPIYQGLAMLSVFLPGRQVQPKQNWKAMRPVYFETPDSFLPAQVEVTYTYVGQRQRNGREEAVLTVEGVIRPAGASGPGGPGASAGPTGGKATGTALVDLLTGQVTLSKIHATIDWEAPAKMPNGQQVKIHVLLVQDARLERRL